MSDLESGELYLSEPWLSIVWDHAHKCVYAQFKGFANSAEFREGATKILEAVHAKHAAALISDNRKLEGVSDQDQLWIRDTWIPMAVDAGVKRIAVVVARAGLGRIASEEIISQSVGKVFATRTFDSLADAVKWLA